jgi:hypothetical protein
VAFEMLSGRKAQPGNTPIEIAHRIATEGTPSLRDAWPQAPAGTVEVLRAALSADPGARPASAGDLVRQLEDSLDLPAAPAARRVQPTPSTATPTPGTTPTTGETGDTTPVEPGPDETARVATDPSPRAESAVAASAAGSPSRNRPRRAAVAAMLAVALLVVGGALLALRPSDGPKPPTEQAERAPAKPASRGPAPERVVRAFYERAAANRYRAAWSLAAPGFREQLGGYGAFRSQFGTLESIRFDRAETTAVSRNEATVAVSTRATHTDRVDTCKGDVALRRSAETKPWLIDHIAVDCAS